MKYRSNLRRYGEVFINLILDFVFPRCCCACKRPLERSSRVLCPRCASLLSWYDTDLHHAEERLWASPIFRELYALYVYKKGNITQKLIYAFKYHQDREAIRFVGKMTQISIPKLKHQDIDFILPVPISWNRLRERGYNQSRLVALELGKIWQIPVRDNILERQNGARSQTKLGKTDRLLNVKHTFRVNEKYAKELHGKRVLLVDDVLTTGSTLVTICELLEAEQVTSVDVFVISVSNYLSF